MAEIVIRRAQQSDAEVCGRIIFRAFTGVADTHHFRRDFQTEDLARGIAVSLLRRASCYGVVAEVSESVVGCAFLSEWDEVRSIGPLAVDPGTQHRGVGRRLMQAVIERGGDKPIRLVQDSFNTVSLGLYLSLGFQVRAPLLLLEGRLAHRSAPGCITRFMTPADSAARDRLCGEVIGTARSGDFDAIPFGHRACMHEREGRLVAYAAAPHFWAVNHAVALTVFDMQALLAGVQALSPEPLSLLVPALNHDLVNFCLSGGMRIVKPMNLMSLGPWQEPRGAYVPSVSY